jgi:Tfp pilus assembly protein PilO
MGLRVPAWLGLTFGELFVVVLLAVLIVSAGYWPRMGAWLAEKIASRKKENSPKLTDK